MGCLIGMYHPIRVIHLRCITHMGDTSRMYHPFGDMGDTSLALSSKSRMYHPKLIYFVILIRINHRNSCFGTYRFLSLTMAENQYRRNILGNKGEIRSGCITQKKGLSWITPSALGVIARCTTVPS